MRSYVILLAILIALSLFVRHFFFHDGVTPATAKHISVVGSTVSMQNISRSIELIGTIAANESVELMAQSTAKIERFYLDDGDVVKKGQVIVVLDSAQERAALGAAKAQLLDKQRELARLEALVKANASTRQQYDLKNTEMRVAAQAVKEIESKIADKTIVASFNGVLGVRRFSEGATVQPGQIITTLDDISVLKVEFNIPSAYVGDFAIGQKVMIRVDGSSHPEVLGVITSVDTRINPKTRSLTAKATIANPPVILKPGLLVKVVLMGNENKVLSVPEESIIQNGTQKFVFTIDSHTNVVKLHEVEIGTRFGGYVEIKKGLAAGELVVRRGVVNLVDGQEVNVEKQE